MTMAPTPVTLEQSESRKRLHTRAEARELRDLLQASSA